MIALSFDIEEFDVPLENSRKIDFAEQIRISEYGTQRILAILKKHNVKATFFCTANFAIHAPETIKKITEDGHEVASHGYYHSHFEYDDLLTSRHKLEEITGTTILGYRMARMMSVDESQVAAAGYSYNSSLNPCFVPGRYNNLKKNAQIHVKNGVVQIPVSVSPHLRIPLFWLTIHNFPFQVYKRIALQTVKKRGYLAIYLHPWEFYELNEIRKLYALSKIMVRNSGRKLESRLDMLIEILKKHGYPFVNMSRLASICGNTV